MRGQTMNDAQRRTFERLRAKGWRGSEGDMFRKAVPMYLDRFVYPDNPEMSRPHVVHIRRDGSVHKGYPTRRNPH